MVVTPANRQGRSPNRLMNGHGNRSAAGQVPRNLRGESKHPRLQESSFHKASGQSGLSGPATPPAFAVVVEAPLDLPDEPKPSIPIELLGLLIDQPFG